MYALADAQTRNLAKKYPHIKMVMTEEVLDDWEAQTLNIPFEKLVRHKKTLKNVISSHLSLIAGQHRKVEDPSQKDSHSQCTTQIQEIPWQGPT